MRLEELGARNFLSWADLSFDLRGMEAVAFTGPNGAGKSTGFDVFSFAVFGKARMAPDELVRTGQTDMEAWATWRLGTERYRVERRRKVRPSGGTTEIDFFHEVDGKWHSINKKTPTETQDHIVKTIGYDYDTATATNIVLQDEWNKFSKSTPGGRLRVITELLGLEKFASMQKKAREKMIAAKARMEQMTVEKGLLEQQGLTEASVAKMEEEIPAIQAKVKILDDGLEAVDARIAKYIEDLATRRTEVQNAKAQAERNRAKTEEAFNLEKQIASYIEMIEQENGIIGAVSIVDAMDGQRMIDELEASVARAKEIAEKYDAAEDQIRTLRQTQATSEETYREARSTLERLQAEVAEGRKVKMTALTSERSDLVAERTGIDAGIGHSSTLAEDATQVKCVDVPEFHTCPLFVRAKAAKDQVDGLARRKAEITERLERIAEEIARLDGEPEPTDVTLQRDLLGCHEAELASRKEEIAKADLELQALKRDLQAANVVVTEYREAVTKAKQRDEQIQESQRKIDAINERVTQMRQRIEEIRAEIIPESDVLEAEAEIGAIEGHRAQAVTEKAEMSASRDTLQGRIKDLEHAVESGKKVIARIADIEKGLVTFAQEHDDYIVLARAYRDGPTLVMENVIPEIERAANEVLARVSPTGIAVQLATQRSSKDEAKVIETLDIVVSDTVGTRKYEAYSGGEKFRVDWALRIGMTSVLASRAGVPMDTLMIDEGFGSLDDQGIADVASTMLHTIKMFALTMVNSHIGRLIQEFPTKIQLENQPGVGTRIVKIDD